MSNKKEVVGQHVTVSAFVCFENKALIVQRASHEPFGADFWELAGGSVELGESVFLATSREVQEETGLFVQPLRPYFVHDFISHLYGHHVIQIGVLCELQKSSPVILSSDHQAFRWIALHELPYVLPLAPIMQRMLSQGFDALQHGVLWDKNITCFASDLYK